MRQSRRSQVHVCSVNPKHVMMLDDAGYSMVLDFPPHRVCVSGRDVRLVTFVSEFVNRFSTGIFVQERIFFIIIIQFRGNLFRYYLVFVQQILIIFVIVIVN